jgi:RNA polymerase subunit RPABC4/transcription elongation factor Spt4
MKNKILASLLLISLTFSALAVNAQEGRKVIAVINKADWCPVCQSNGERMMKEIIPMFEQSNVQFVMNDLTNDATKADSKIKLNEAKVFGAVKKINATGLLVLVDAATGKILEKISVAEPSEKLIKAIKQSSMMDKM